MKIFYSTSRKDYTLFIPNKGHFWFDAGTLEQAILECAKCGVSVTAADVVETA